MVTIDERKAMFMQEIEEAGENWDRVAELAKEGLELDPDWFDAATRWQAACCEISAREARRMYDFVRGERNLDPIDFRKPIAPAWEALGAAEMARDANRLVRKLADAQVS